MSNAGLMSSPICLVENVNGSLSVCKHALEFLSRIKEPVVVVSVVGLYRTGKSYLMNRLAGQQSGFALGSAVESKTKGIWMWCVPHPKKEGHTLVLLDTEGLGDVDKGDSKNDSWIFCLAVLLSSTLVYNSRGTIDNTALENLHYVTELSEQINIRSPLSIPDGAAEGDDCHFVRFFPSFIWVLRDFTLKLEADGKKMTEDEYIEFALDLKKVLGRLVQIYVDTISNGEVPCLDNAVATLAILENEAAVQKAIKVYQSAIEEVKNMFPISVIDITSEHQKFSNLAISEFIKGSFKDEKGEYLIKLMEAVSKCFVGLLQENEMASERKCRNLLKNLFSDMNKRLQDGEYSQSGGYELYCRDRDAIVEQYRREPNKGVSAEAMLNEFMKDRGPESKSILCIDTKLSENDRKIQEEKEASALLEQRGKEEEEKIIVRERMLQEERKQHAARIQQMQEKFKSEMEQQQQELDRAMESKLKEMKELIMKGFKEKADFLEEEINNLKKEKEEKGSSSFMDVLMVLIRNMEKLLPLMLEFTGKNSKP